MDAVAYLRVSGKGQVDGDGFKRQASVIASFARSRKIKVLEEYRDEGVSGTKPLADRPGLSRLLERVLSNGVRVVLVEQASRLARDLIQGELILRELRDAGLVVIAADSGADLSAGSDEPTAKLIRQVLGAVSEFEKSALVSKLRAARARIRRTRGRCEGVKPYGESEIERRALARLKQLARKPRGGKRRSLREIADTLTAEGFPTRSGRPWSRSTVHSLLGRTLKA